MKTLIPASFGTRELSWELDDSHCSRLKLKRGRCRKVWRSRTLTNCQEFDLFQIGRSHLGNPGIVVGGKAYFLLKGVNLALHGSDLGFGKLWNHSDLLPNRVHGGCDLLFSATGGARVSIGALHAVHNALGHLLAVHQRHSDVALSCDDVSDSEHARHRAVARHILAGECVVFAIHVDPWKFLRHRTDRRNDQRRAQLLFRAWDRFSLAAFDFRFNYLQSHKAPILHDDARRQPAILDAEQIFVARQAQHFLPNHLRLCDLFRGRVVRWLRQRHVLFAAAINQETALDAQFFRLYAVRFAHFRNPLFQLMHAGLNAASLQRALVVFKLKNF